MGWHECPGQYVLSAVQRKRVRSMFVDHAVKWTGGQWISRDFKLRIQVQSQLHGAAPVVSLLVWPGGGSSRSTYPLQTCYQRH